jgi:hypothetical protein
MIVLMTAALVAGQPAPVADSHGQMAPMNQQKHEAMEEKCCCEDMAKGEHDNHADSLRPQVHRGE